MQISPNEELDSGRDDAAAALAALEAGVRLRRGELAALGTGGEGLAARLTELRQREFVQEPRPVSPRPGVGRLLVLARKLFYHLGFKWHARAVLQQQNEFNQAAAALIVELADREREAHRQIERLRARLDELAPGPEPPGPAA